VRDPSAPDHGYKGRSVAWFKEHFPGLCVDDGGFAFAALHLLHHTQVARIPMDDAGLVMALITIDPDDADHLNH
jgi:hypothetical protein